MPSRKIPLKNSLADFPLRGGGVPPISDKGFLANRFSAKGGGGEGTLSGENPLGSF